MTGGMRASGPAIVSSPRLRGRFTFGIAVTTGSFNTKSASGVSLYPIGVKCSWRSGFSASGPERTKAMAKAPGVSPLRVALVNAHRADADGAPPDGKGIVRVR